MIAAPSPLRHRRVPLEAQSIFRPRYHSYRTLWAFCAGLAVGALLGLLWR